MSLNSKSALPDPKFTSVLIDRHRLKGKGLLRINSQLGTDVLDEPEQQVVRLAGLEGVEYGNLFAYMYRRFGPPNYPADDYKDFSAGWLLSTPDPDLYAKVLPVLHDGSIEDLGDFRFGWLQAHYLCQEGISASDLNELFTPAQKLAFRQALIATGKDLLRPVGVRDQYLNCIGPVDDESPLLVEQPEDEDEPLYVVRHARSSGRPIPAGLMGTQAWIDLMGTAYRLGDKDFEAGLQCLAKLAEDVRPIERPGATS